MISGRKVSYVAVVMVLTCALVQAAKKESLDQLKERASSARIEDQPKLLVKIAQRQLEETTDAYKDGETERAQVALQDIVNFSEQATLAAQTSRKDLKNTEIAIRKITQRLEDIARTLSFEERQPVREAIDKLESLRTALLAFMFK